MWRVRIGKIGKGSGARIRSARKKEGEMLFNKDKRPYIRNHKL
jgi:hypothetical protein